MVGQPSWRALAGVAAGWSLGSVGADRLFAAVAAMVVLVGVVVWLLVAW